MPFQSTLPRRERPGCTPRRRAGRAFQSTLPRRERREPRYGCAWADGISIHAPAKGATVFGLLCFSKTFISIHAPAKGATRRGAGQGYNRRISIHAPAKGATSLCVYINACSVGISIHAPAKGATCMISNFSVSVTIFQSTLPRRERRGGGSGPASPPAISIHAPAKGATRTNANTAQRKLISIHAPAKGATPRPRRTRRGTQNFNPRSREGSDDTMHPCILLQL